MDTAIVKYNGSLFYHITSDSNSKVLVFLHGGVNNPTFDDTSKIHNLNFLLEGNNDFIHSALTNKFDLLIPITNDSLDWLINHPYVFKWIQSYLTTTKHYDSHYISGFSDGGTGSYKIFYNHTEYFDGLVVFNGYPQHQNFNKNVDYEKVENKKIIFFSTDNDKTIPYEFLLIEYCKQKMSNANTFFYLTKGTHSFAAYSAKEINLCFDILTSKIINTQKEAEPIHGFVQNDRLTEFYTFRKKITKKYGYGKAFYKLNKAQKKRLKK